MNQNKKLTIKDWDTLDKPREKLVLKGANHLSDAELIAILIGSGNKNETAVELARRILADNNSNLNKLAKLTVSDFIKYKGIGEAKAVSIVAALELGKRKAQAKIEQRKQIISNQDAFDYMCPILCDLTHEELWAIFLNNSSKIITRSKISQGSVNQINVDTKIIIKKALDNYATGIIICHNHPSGNPQPSNNDIDLTKRLKFAANFFDIKILDHIIIADNNFFSFNEAKIL
jgi:DNA repair protein RadC